MKDKKKSNHSLTAKERKAQRLGTLAGNKETKVESETKPLEQDESTGVVSVGKNSSNERLMRHKPIIILCASVLAVILIVAALLITLVFAPLYDYRDINNPVAVIHLSNGDKIELEIFEYETPNGATNFLYLAQKGFFDDTIIFDTTNKYVRFGQYQSNAYENRNLMTTEERIAYEQKIYRSLNPQFTKHITDISIPSQYTLDSVFDYRMKAETAATAKNYDGFASKYGYLSNIYDISGTEFQICTETNQPLSNPRKDDASTTPQSMRGYVIGQIIGTQSYDVVKEIAAMDKNLNNGHTIWSEPVELIRIKKVKLYKMDMRGKWRNFNWNEYMNDNSAISWSGGSGRK